MHTAPRPISITARFRAGRALAELVIPELEAGRSYFDVLDDPPVRAVLDERPYLVEDLASHHVIAQAITAEIAAWDALVEDEALHLPFDERRHAVPA